MKSLVILLALVTGAQENEGISWKTYQQARQLSSSENKPIAVFVGAGQDGYRNVVDGNISKEALEVLTTQYVPVYVNTATAEGKALAQAFQITGVGIVVSDRTGGYQVFSQQGTLTSLELVSQLNRLLRTTRTSLYAPEGNVGGYATAVAPDGTVYEIGHKGGCSTGGCSTGGCYTASCSTGGCFTASCNTGCNVSCNTGCYTGCDSGCHSRGRKCGGGRSRGCGRGCR